ncbi:hypothetical protein ACFSJT_17870, partial [Aquimarina celericrescens]
LPEETKSYVPNDNIYSAMLLRPYIRGFIEDEKYYFANKDQKRKYNLDILLVTQGWSKYSWNRIFTKPPKPMFDFNQGFRLKGKIQGKSKENVAKVYIHPTKYQKARFIDVDETGAFELPNFFPEKGETIRLSGVMYDDSFVKPTLYFETQLEQRITPLRRDLLQSKNIFYRKGVIRNLEIPRGFITNRTQVLDEVLLKADKKKEEKSSTIPMIKYFNRNSKKITKRMAEDFPSILDYIKSTGKFWIRDLAPYSSEVVIYDRLPNSILAAKEIPVFIDNTELVGDSSLLAIMRTSEVDRIYIDRTSYGLGARGGAGGSIRIYTRKIPIPSQIDFNYNSLEIKMKKGYEPVKEFYNPGYANYSDSGFIDYGVIHWQPWIDFNDKGKGKFMIKNTGLDHITFFIEGLGSDGSLISKRQTIKVN